MAKLENALAGIIGELGRFVRTFVIAYSAAIVLGIVAALAAYHVSAANGSSNRGVAGALMAFGLFAVIGLLAVIKLAAFLTIARIVSAQKLGVQILNALFNEMMGVTPEKPQGDHELTKNLHGMPVREVRTHVRAAARKVLQKNMFIANLPRFARWFARQAAKALVWVTVRIIVSNCATGHSLDDTIDMIVVRDRLGEHIDGMLMERLRQEAIHFAWLFAIALVLMSYLLALGVRSLP